MSEFSDLSMLFMIFLASGIAVGIGMRPLLAVLRHWQVMDMPNERSSHAAPTPVGGGLLVIPVLLVMWWAIADRSVVAVLGVAAFLAAMSFLDDRGGLPTFLRLAAHGVAVALVLFIEPGLADPVGQFLPAPASHLATGFAWVWFINLFNFMDGIDGISGVETLTIGLGVAAVVVIGGLAPDLAGFGLALAGASIGFLMWNWHPARIFLGDVGSVPLGFLIGWLLLSLAQSGAWAAALVLPGYYLFDATWTLVRRVVQGEKFWRAHRGHFYQRAVITGMGHGEVAGFIFAGNLVLVLLAVASVSGNPWICLTGGMVVAGGLAIILAGHGRPGGG